MTITEKIPHSSLVEVKFYKEGVFWVAYEQSAYHIHQQKGYRATKKLVKILGQETVSIGFPQSSYETYLKTTTSVLEQDEPCIKVFSLDQAIDMAAFRQWKALASSLQPGETASSGAVRRVRRKGLKARVLKSYLLFKRVPVKFSKPPFLN
ncbi:hypothetical protein FACS189451_12640 [Bacteroidia bacterium]|nr:hypothetical protein FACS189451_12640 [Bacteroidia bacterium]